MRLALVAGAVTAVMRLLAGQLRVRRRRERERETPPVFFSRVVFFNARGKLLAWGCGGGNEHPACACRRTQCGCSRGRGAEHSGHGPLPTRIVLVSGGRGHTRPSPP